MKPTDDSMRELLPVIGSSVFFDLSKSILLLLILLLARTILVRWIKGNPTLTIDAKRRWIVTTRNSMVLCLFVGLVVIWARVGSLRGLARRIGGHLGTGHKGADSLLERRALRVGGGVYGVGDRIQLGTYRGVVLEYDVFATKLLEIGPGQTSHLYTGPNRRVSQQSAFRQSSHQGKSIARIWSVRLNGSVVEH